MTATSEAAWRAATRMHHRYLTGLILYTLQKRGEEAATELVFRTFREQHHEKFLPGLKRLGLEGLPPAVAAGGGGSLGPDNDPMARAQCPGLPGQARQ